MRRRLGLADNYELTLHEAIPAHAGLGSGTQLALAVAAAVRHLEGFEQNVPNDAELLQRGARSGAGAGLFTQGGFIVDGGHGPRKGTPPVLARMAFPDAWRILLITDSGVQGVHGEAERAAFAALPQFQESAAADICRCVLMQALPALVEQDISQFGAAITQIQMILGDYFAPAQGGRYTSLAVAKIMSALKDAGAYGTGQSSWGPTGFAFVESEAKARQLADQISQDAAKANVGVLICKGMNSGAKIATEITAELAAKSREHSIQSGQ
jgi:beta-RFAP synthase